ncbi:MAG: hypothetical protein JXR31_06160 [Prolixibacteraceae bacterium]|nr:hypothetical protein [Prolixibacteraceae bacterium]MBN2773813.1 hypothetical protein [Prolixibacteraceae bacterium]
MPEKKEQKIVVLIENKESDNNLILHGIKLAAAFKKELCFLLVQNNKQISKLSESIIAGYKAVVKRDIPVLPVSDLILNGKPKDLIDPLVDEHEAILIILRNKLFKNWASAVRISPVPFLFVNENQNSVPDYKKVVLPLDLRKESKDSVLWASYFARFNNSGINVLAANDNIKDNIKSVQKNILMMKKLFTKFNIALKIFKGTSGSMKIQFEALELAKSSGAEMIIILGSSYISFIDIFIGLPENKIIRNAGTLPVLLINPRRDLYIMCD